WRSMPCRRCSSNSARRGEALACSTRERLLRPVDRPFARGRNLFEGGIRINRKGMTRELEHRLVVHGVAEDRIDAVTDEFADGGGFAFAAGNADEFTGGATVGAKNFRGEHALRRDPELTRAVVHDPVIR